MAQIAVIGDFQSVQCFRSVGFTVFAVSNDEDSTATLKEVIKNGFEIIFITELLSVKLKDIIQKYKSSPTPSIIPIPSVQGNLGYGMAAIKRNVEKAVGADILK
ncbi:MAG: V-type ATP synthase subunit F [Clostridia bacterium]